MGCCGSTSNPLVGMWHCSERDVTWVFSEDYKWFGGNDTGSYRISHLENISGDDIDCNFFIYFDHPVNVGGLSMSYGDVWVVSHLIGDSMLIEAADETLTFDKIQPVS